MIEGAVIMPGGGGSGRPPPFRVTVPSVDVDWEGFTDWNHEGGEDARFVIAPFTNAVPAIRWLRVNIPYDDYTLVHPVLTLHWAGANDLRLLREDGTLFANGGQIDSRAVPSWPLRFRVEPLSPTPEFEVRLLGEADNVTGEKAVDTIHGRIVNADLDLDANYDDVINGADEPLEETPGGLACVRTNNLTPITLTLAPKPGLPGKLTLSANVDDTRIKVWQDAGRTVPVALPKVWNAGAAAPGTLYVEGITPSAAVRDVELRLEYDENPAGQSNPLFKCADVIRLTILKVELTNIKFNHDTGSSVSDALNIRQDYTTAFNISNGEWVKGGANIPACYTTNKAVTIKARFTVQPASITNMDIWAVSTDVDGSLGGVAKTNVTFSGGVSSPEYVTFQVSGTTPACIQKTTNDVWQWKMENVNGSGSGACNLNTSGVHTVYTILNEPVTPWVNTAASQLNAWTEALDYSCDWAALKQTKTDAETIITKGIYECGKFQYDGPPTVPGGDGSSRYVDWVDGKFKLTQCLTDLASSGVVDVNCTDCGNMVTLFANLVGCDLWSSKMADSWPPVVGFDCNQIVVIGAGAGNWTEPFGGSGFSYHEVGWTGTCGNNDKVFDPCLHVDGNGDPSAAPRIEKYPAGMIFSDGNQGAPYVYRESLAAPGANGYDKCLAQPGEKLRRILK